MLISQDITNVSPLFKLERSGTTVSMTLSSSANGWYDEEQGIYLWDGDIYAALGSRDYYFYQDADRPLDAFVQETLVPKVVTAGSYVINFGQYDVTFGVVIFDSPAAFAGTAGRDYAFGSAFADRLSGGASDDGFEGAGGDDVLNGGPGGDLLDGGDGSDTASYAGASAGVTVHLARASLNLGDAAGDRFLAIENLRGSEFSDDLYGDKSPNSIAGNGGADFIYGLEGDDTLDGGDGGDALFGGPGNDLLTGGAGLDNLNGGTGTDTVSYALSASGVIASLNPGSANAGDAAGDTFQSIENLIGSRFADRLTGNSGVNALDGGRGDDYIRGNGGADVLSGGLGKDKFFYAVAGPADTILDFTVGDDRIVLDNAGFSGLATGPLSAAAFHVGAAATAAGQRIIYNAATGELSFDADGSGAGSAVAFAVLTGSPGVTEADFLIV